MSKNAIAIIQARMSSKRLPGKVLLNLAGKPMLWHIIQRLKKCKYVDKIVIATSVEVSDNPIEDFCRKNDFLFYRGSLNNVFQRFIDVIRNYPHNYFVRITADCPLITPVFIDKQIIALKKYDADLVCLTEDIPVLAGQGVQSCKSLLRIVDKIISKEDKEHVASIYITNNPKEFQIVGLNAPEIYTKNKFRVTVDELDDYNFMNSLYEKLWENNKPIDTVEAINWMKSNNSIININKNVEDSKVNRLVKSKHKLLLDNVKFLFDWNVN